MKVAYKFLIACTLICMSTNLFSQEAMGNKSIKKNSIEVYFPIKHFFDETVTNWLILKPHFIERDNTGKVFPDNEKYSVPCTFGIQYYRKLENRNDLRISTTAYFMSYGLNRLNTNPLEVFKRFYGLLSSSYLHTFLSDTIRKIQILGGVNYRYGNEMIHMYYENKAEPGIASLRMNDLGLSMGFRLERLLHYNFLLSGEIKYTRYIYRASKGMEFLGQNMNITPNAFTIKLGIGYCF